VKDGLLPNLFPEGHRTAVYNTVDATFWYFHAIDRYLDRTGDDETLRFLYPTLQDIIRHHIHGTHFGIGMDPADGLMRAGEERYQLTWMDAKVGDWVVTPRRGKPVEIQALWYNALRLMAVWAQDMGEDNAPYETLARKVYESFNARFWRGAEQCLYDVVDGDPEEGTRLRPNMIFSVSLRFPVLAEDRWRPVVDKVAERLLTPYGLRSLDPAHKDYRSRYEGNLLARDAAYHQGLVWGWLIGPFIDAWLKVYHDKAKARRLLEGFESHLIEHGVGSVSEIFDADPPHRPRGCIAQAWSVAEVLRAYLATEPD
jgi:predicted glycogen debranching enzyme